MFVTTNQSGAVAFTSVKADKDRAMKKMLERTSFATESKMRDPDGFE